MVLNLAGSVSMLQIASRDATMVWASGVIVLQKREQFEKQHVVPLPKLVKVVFPLLPMIVAKLIHQVIDLILECDLREHTDGLGLAESLFQ